MELLYRVLGAFAGVNYAISRFRINFIPTNFIALPLFLVFVYAAIDHILAHGPDTFLWAAGALLTMVVFLGLLVTLCWQYVVFLPSGTVTGVNLTSPPPTKP